MSPRVLLIDNYDSFTYNLYQYLCELGAEVTVRRTDQITVDEAEAFAPDFLVVSPGPGSPKDAGISIEVIRRIGPKVPTLGVCLGHVNVVASAPGGEAETLPAELEVTARSDSGVIMGIRHRSLPIEGVQFHPESILTDGGKRMLANFLKLPAGAVQ